MDESSKLLLEQNNKLKTALENLKEVLLQERSKFGNAIHDLKQENEMISVLQESVQTLESDLEEKNEMVKNLREALDERKDAEEMIEQLTDQKLTLQDV